MSLRTESYKSHTCLVGKGRPGIFSSVRICCMRDSKVLLTPVFPPAAGGIKRPDWRYGFWGMGCGAVEAKLWSSNSGLSTIAEPGTGVADRDGCHESVPLGIRLPVAAKTCPPIFFSFRRCVSISRNSFRSSISSCSSFLLRLHIRSICAVRSRSDAASNILLVDPVPTFVMSGCAVGAAVAKALAAAVSSKF